MADFGLVHVADLSTAPAQVSIPDYCLPRYLDAINIEDTPTGTLNSSVVWYVRASLVVRNYICIRGRTTVACIFGGM